MESSYCLITCEQLKHANLSILFPKDKLRDEPLAITDLDTAFNYDSTIPVEQNRAFHFDPTIPPEKFGPKPIKQSRNRINHDPAIAGYHIGIAAAGALGLAHTQQARAVERGLGMYPVPIGPNVQRLINLNFITAAHYRALSYVERHNIVSTHELIASGLITIDEARLLSNKEMKILEKPSVCSLLLQHQMTVAQAKALTPQQINRIEDGHANEVLQHLSQDAHGDPSDGFRMG